MKKTLLIILTISIVLNLILAYYIWLGNLGKPSNVKEANQNYSYLSKRIFAEDQNDLLINFINLRTPLRQYVGSQKDKIGVYFEYLPSGTSIGVNDQLEVPIVSLVKVPIIMAVYEQIEKGFIKKDQVLTIKEENIDKKFGTLWKKGEGTKITVEKAIRLSLIESDNTASSLLLSLVPGSIDRVFDSLDIPKETENKYHVISPKNYSSIFRSLYLSSYLSRQSSNEILDILTQTIFNDKIAAGVPQEIRTAHKIGVLNSADSLVTIYSDCGIVYVPRRPYALCIFVEGDEEKAREYMQFISKMAYSYMIAVK